MATPSSDESFLSLTVTLAGRPYPLRVLPDDEEPIRQIARELNDKFSDFRESYPSKDAQDCLAMLLLIYAVDLFKVKGGDQRSDPRLIRALGALERSLSEALTAPAPTG